MAVTKTIAVDGREVSSVPPPPSLGFTETSSTGTSKDLNELQKGIDENDAESSNLDTFSLELFENIAWLMAKHAESDVPDTPEDWLDSSTHSRFMRSCRRSSSCGD
jgi:hypothetical protein